MLQKELENLAELNKSTDIVSGSFPVEWTHRKCIVFAIVYSKLFFEIIERIERVRGVEILVVFSVETFNFTVVTRCKWLNELMLLSETKGKQKMNIVKINDSDKTKYMDLLLIADEQVSMIEKYLYRGDMFALYDDDIRALCVVTQERTGVYELKNIVTVPEYQRKGYGQSLIAFISDHYKKYGSELYVGTGDSPSTLCFYEKAGFVRSHVVKNFFTDNYDHPMFEDGKQLIDMIYLKRNL